MSEAAVEHYLGQYSRLPPSSSTWINEVRESAIQQFRRNGFPTPRNENWKYTDIRPIVKRDFVAIVPGPGAVPMELLDKYSFRQMDCHELVFANGWFLPDCSTAQDQGVLIKSLAEVLKDDDTGIRTSLETSAARHKNAFDELNSAFISDGACLCIPDGVALEKPIHLLFLGQPQLQPPMSHIRNIIIAGKHTRATIIETYAGQEGAEYFTNTITEIAADEGSQLAHYKLQQESLKSYHVGSLRASLKRDSRLESHSISLGGALVRNNIDTDLIESGSEIVMNGLYIGGGKQHIDNHTCVNHLVAHTTSAEYYRGVLDGSARGVFNGRVVVHEQAQKTDAHQSNANLLLSDNAEVDTKPELEIYADDVKCSHGATIGQLDETMLFYLRSRAIDKNTAMSLLTYAFAEDVIKRIGFQPVRDRLELSVVGKLPDTDLIRNFIK